MKYEPLKGKICRLVDAPWDVDEEERAFDFRDVKSAVQGFIKEVKFYTDEDGDCLLPTDEIIELVKKWFADVINKEEER